MKFMTLKQSLWSQTTFIKADHDTNNSALAEMAGNRASADLAVVILLPCRERNSFVRFT